MVLTGLAVGVLLRQQVGVALGFLDRVESLALEVLDGSELSAVLSSNSRTMQGAVGILMSSAAVQRRSPQTIS